LPMVLSFSWVIGLLCYFLVSWLIVGLAAWLLATAVTGIGAGALPVIVAGYAFAYVVGMAAFIIPSGLGVREAVLAASLAARLPGSVALAWAVLLRLWQTLVELLAVAGVTLADRATSPAGEAARGAAKEEDP
jgi:uncharacterized membrane protein YbhN (UPF0104 family)